MTDHVCAWAAASPARYRASSSAMAASKSSGSNVTSVVIRSSASISTICRRSTSERAGLLVGARVSGTSEDEALAADRNGGRRRVHDPEVGGRSVTLDHGIPPVEVEIHHPTTIVAVAVVGQDVSHGVPVAGRKERQEAIIELACRVLQPPCPRMHFLEPGMRGVEFGERGVDVFDVEQHLQRDSTFLVDAEYSWSISSCGAPGSDLCADLQSGESQALASHGDNRVADPPCPSREGVSASRGHSPDGRSVWREADDLPATLDEDVWG